MKKELVTALLASALVSPSGSQTLSSRERKSRGAVKRATVSRAT